MTLRRRNSIATSSVIPSHLTLPHLSSSFTTATSSSSSATSSSSSSATSSSSSTDFDLLPAKPILPSYTSLKDLIPATAYAAIQSPTAATPAGGEISIRNRLVKQAAWAYLQPMSTSPNSATDHLFRRVATRILRSPLFSLLRTVARVFCFCFL